MSTPPIESPQNMPTEPTLGEMHFTYFIPPAPALTQTEGQNTPDNYQDNNLNVTDKLSMTLRPAFTEHQQAKKSYFAFNKHARNFYLNLLIRPYWGRSPEHLRNAFTLGLIYPSSPPRRLLS